MGAPPPPPTSLPEAMVSAGLVDEPALMQRKAGRGLVSSKKRGGKPGPKGQTAPNFNDGLAKEGRSRIGPGCGPELVREALVHIL